MSGGPEGPGLRVLVTNRVLANRTGTELYVRDLAVGLLKAGHHPVVYSPLLGPVAAEIRAATVPVVDDLAHVGRAPDVIHGHHGPETLAALLAFPGVPAVALCHSAVGWPDAPLRFPRVLRYVAVDHACRDRLVSEHGVPGDRVAVALNAVDLERFRPRPPLPPRPRRALVFSNLAGGRAGHLAAIRAACARAGIAVDVAGTRSRKPLERPEEVLGRYDLVFARARAALEAMAVGAAVVLCDAPGAGPMVTTANLDRLRPLNFGVSTLGEPATPQVLAREIARYDPADAAAVSRRVRAEAGAGALVDALVALYREVIAEHRAGPADDLAAEQRAAAAYLQWLAPRLYERDLLRAGFGTLLRLPLVGAAVRARARRESPGHWLAQLVARMERE
ncbi:MAG TPA: glycosyltransferase family 4 protein [Longimicrobium sp.]|nr:glycosyltransferase family 4 protein [Longimicrobium sp.]